jgi:2'-5' RNA ligase
LIVLDKAAEKTIRVNIALKPSSEVEQQAINLSRQLSGRGESYFILDGTAFYPHITIYAPPYLESQLKEVLEVAQKISGNFSRPKCMFTTIKAHQGYLGIGIHLSEEIKRFHEETVLRLNPLRERELRSGYTLGLDYHLYFSKAQEKSLLMYGYPGVVDLYQPHLTIIRFKNSVLAEEMAGSIDWGIKEFAADTLAVFIMGEHGTCKKLIREFALSNRG